MLRAPAFRSCPVETRSSSGEQRLAAKMIEVALADARRGDEAARTWLSSPTLLSPWAETLHVAPADLAAFAAGALRTTRP